MSRSTFNGPVLVGVDDAEFHAYTTGTLTAGPNWGFVNMSQSSEIKQSTNTRFPLSTKAESSEETPGGPPLYPMVIPARSIITRVSVLVTTAWSGGTIDIGLGWETQPGSGYTIAGLANDLVLTALGMVVVGPGDTDIAGDVDNWMNIINENPAETRDRYIMTKSSTGTAGRGVLTVNYCQAVDLSAIA